MLNGAGMLHGGCVAYLIDKYVYIYPGLKTNTDLNFKLHSQYSCCSTPLVVLGLIRSVNGVGVTQSMNVHFHAPAPKYVPICHFPPLPRPFCLLVYL